MEKSNFSMDLLTESIANVFQFVAYENPLSSYSPTRSQRFDGPNLAYLVFMNGAQKATLPMLYHRKLFTATSSTNVLTFEGFMCFSFSNAKKLYLVDWIQQLKNLGKSVLPSVSEFVFVCLFAHCQAVS